MAESFEEQGIAVEAKPEGEPHEGTETLAVSMNDFSALEERVLRAVDLVKRERGERAAAEARVAQAEERAAQAETRGAQLEERAVTAEARVAQTENDLLEQMAAAEKLQAEVKSLRAERDHVRHRVERLLEQLDGLEL